jgi:hypothetical protein
MERADEAKYDVASDQLPWPNGRVGGKGTQPGDLEVPALSLCVFGDSRFRTLENGEKWKVGSLTRQ